MDACDACVPMSISYNSCRNRHCPKCQGHKREEWIQAREADLLPVPYFHVVFTLPAALNGLALEQPKAVYDALFASSWQTLEGFGKNKCMQMGMISVLHTWVGPSMRAESEFASSLALHRSRRRFGCQGQLAKPASRW